MSGGVTVWNGFTVVIDLYSAARVVKIQWLHKQTRGLSTYCWRILWPCSIVPIVVAIRRAVRKCFGLYIRAYVDE